MPETKPRGSVASALAALGWSGATSLVGGLLAVSLAYYDLKTGAVLGREWDYSLVGAGIGCLLGMNFTNR